MYREVSTTKNLNSRSQETKYFNKEKDTSFTFFLDLILFLGATDKIGIVGEGEKFAVKRA